MHSSANDIRVPRCGRVIVTNGKLVSVQPARFGLRPSSFRILMDSRFRSLPVDHCVLDYSGSRATPGYLTLDYVSAGPHTSLATFRGTLLVLDEIARIRQAVAIFAHVGTTAISDRLLRRWGWEPHAGKLSGRHWIKRFYSGYPCHDLAHLGVQGTILSDS